MANAEISYTTGSRSCQHLAADSPAPSPGHLSEREALVELHKLGLRLVRFSKRKVPFDLRHRNWGLSLDALLRTYEDPRLLVGWIPASVKAAAVDVDTGDWRRLVELYPSAYHTGDWRRLVELYPSAYHAASGTPGRRHLVYRDRKPRADVNGWRALGCSGDVRSEGPIILYDPARLLVALTMGLRGVTYPMSVFGNTFRESGGHGREGGKSSSQKGTRPPHPITTRTTQKETPSQILATPRGSDMATVSPRFPLPAEASSQSATLFDRLRHWAYAHVADAGNPDDWLETVHRQANSMVHTVPDPEHYSPARVATTARSVAGWTWERRDKLVGGHRDVDSEAQSRRARRGVERRWAVNLLRDEEIVRLSLAGLSQRAIAASMDITQPIVNRVLQRLEDVDGALELQMELPEPDHEQEPVAEDLERRNRKPKPLTWDQTPWEKPVGTLGEARSPRTYDPLPVSKGQGTHRPGPGPGANRDVLPGRELQGHGEGKRLEMPGSGTFGPAVWKYYQAGLAYTCPTPAGNQNSSI